MDKVRAHREMLKSMWFNLDHSNTPIIKEIVVEMDKYPSRKGQGIVKILDDGPDGYSCFTTHQENPIEYAKNRLKENKYKEFKLVIKDENNT
tara:strand:- start:67 stop:342 length:276 start_codon:yes stop_codon:yes gene_type:complete